ncbi:MAG: RNA polymerase factor sigma-54 [Gammaproteobacteria bacterium BRH_c0]|nr:MAG: RNA polymerase factor sigma-54 [Gammaproteobacteria bacterium BRH_c0]
MRQTLQLKIGQQLTMTPQLQQAIKLLQLSSLDLQLEIQQALYSNPLLELVEEFDGPEAESSAESSADDAQMSSDDWENAAIPEELPVDAKWDDIYPTASSSSQSQGSDNRDFESFHSVTDSLQDHLLWQLNLTPMSALDNLIATAIIDSINDNGLLEVPIEEIHQSFADNGVELDEVVAVLHRIQQFDPPGVGAADLSDCLLIQLRQFAPDTPYLNQAMELVTRYLGLVAERDINQLRRKTGMDTGELTEAIRLIQSLSPRPGEHIGNSDVEYVVPDVRVVRVNGTWQVSLNGDIAPKVCINQQYADMVRRADNSDDNTFLRNQLQEARWFLRSLESRNETLLRVSSCIVEMQRGFLEQGPEAMRPMVLADVADKLGLHESTISRVTTQKYMDTPQGVFELKYFFSSHVSTNSGGECSSTAIRAMLKKMISSENPEKPLSDNKIADLFDEQGIQVARRTVAKYREAMGIPTSSERKRFKQGAC